MADSDREDASEESGRFGGRDLVDEDIENSRSGSRTEEWFVVAAYPARHGAGGLPMSTRRRLGRRAAR